MTRTYVLKFQCLPAHAVHPVNTARNVCGWGRVVAHACACTHCGLGGGSSRMISVGAASFGSRGEKCVRACVRGFVCVCSVCLPVCVSVYLSVCVAVCLPICLVQCDYYSLANIHYSISQYMQLVWQYKYKMQNPICPRHPPLNGTMKHTFHWSSRPIKVKAPRCPHVKARRGQVANIKTWEQ